MDVPILTEAYVAYECKVIDSRTTVTLTGSWV